MSLQQVQTVDEFDHSNVVTATVYVPPKGGQDSAAVVMLPFWGGSAKTYAKVQSALAEKCPNTASIAVSYRGTGTATNKHLDTDHRQYAISTVAAGLAKFLRSDAVTSLVDTTRLILCGQSWSAKVSLAFLIREASAANVAVHSLLFVAPAPVHPIVLEAGDREYRRSAYSSFESAKATVENVLAHRKLSEEDVTELAQHMVSMSPASKRGWIEVGIWEDWSTDVQQFAVERPQERVPIHVMVATHDNVEPAEKVERESVEYLRGLGFPVDMTSVEDCGHLLPLEAPDAVASALQKLVVAN